MCKNYILIGGFQTLFAIVIRNIFFKDKLDLNPICCMTCSDVVFP